VSVQVFPVEGLPEVVPGDDLAALLGPPLRAAGVRDGDVLAVTQKVVSKAEGSLVPAGERASAIAAESVALVAERGDVVIVRTRHGFVCANAGVDASNVPAGWLTLLPDDPDASAERLQKELSAALDLGRLAVVVTDTFGRPWREGVVDVAIGCAGLPPLVDLRGTHDDRGQVLESTVVALADAVAAASGLVMRKAARVPAALVRGIAEMDGDAPPGPASALIRRSDDDLFRESALTAAAAAGPLDRVDAGPLPAGIVEEAVRATARHAAGILVAATSPAALRRLRRSAPAHRALDSAPAAVVACVPDGSRPGALRAGMAVGALSVALRAVGLAWAWEPEASLDAAAVAAAMELGDGVRPTAIVAIGRQPEGVAAPRPRPPAAP
jgi:coenzyme F420-0:L-glutamate ligase/coenzyme F420-1:gamma-L-glutamate ligase